MSSAAFAGPSSWKTSHCSSLRRPRPAIRWRLADRSHKQLDMVRGLTILAVVAELYASSVARAADPSTLFAGNTVFELKISAPWNELLTKARADDAFSVSGKLS